MADEIPNKNNRNNSPLVINPKGGLTLYEGKTERDLVGEDIDERILRLLGIEDVFDIDYGTYYSLLRERLVESRSFGRTLSTEEDELLINEVKRVRGKVGRFKVKKKRINANTFFRKKGTSKSEQESEEDKKINKNLLLPPSTILTPNDFSDEKKKSKRSKETLLSIAKSIRKSVESIHKTILDQSNQTKKETEFARRSRENRARRKKEDELEKEKKPAFLDSIKKIIAPAQGILQKIIKFIVGVILGRAFTMFMEWAGDPKNRKKLEHLAKFVGDFFPALLAAWFFFANPLGKFIRSVVGTVGKLTFHLLKWGLPRLIAAAKRNPKTALALGTAAAGTAAFTAGSWAPSIFPGLADEQERNTKNQPGSNQEKISALENQKQNLNIFEKLQGKGSEIDEQIHYLKTGETKKYAAGGEVFHGQVDSKTGKRISGAGSDTQLLDVVDSSGQPKGKAVLKVGEIVLNEQQQSQIAADTGRHPREYVDQARPKSISSEKLGLMNTGGIVAYASGGTIGGSTPSINVNAPISPTITSSAFSPSTPSLTLPSSISTPNYSVSNVTNQTSTAFNPKTPALSKPLSGISTSSASSSTGGGDSLLDRIKKWFGIGAEKSSGSGAETTGFSSGASAGMAENTKGAPYSFVSSKIGASKDQWDIFRNTIAKIESGGKYDISGGSGGHYDGRYQLGAAAKTDGSRHAGIPDPGHSPSAREKFRKDSDLQEKLFAGYTAANHSYLMRNRKYREASIERKLQILGYAHNQGMGGAENWLNTGQVGADGFGTKGTKYTDALAQNFRKAGKTPSGDVASKSNKDKAAFGGGLISLMNGGLISLASGGLIGPMKDGKESSGGGSPSKKTMDYLISNGLSKEQAAGIAGNIQQESGFRPNADNGTHYGIAQWDKQNRWPKVSEYIKSQGKNPNTLEGQLFGLVWEAKQRGDWNKIRSTTTPEAAADSWLKNFERSGEKPGHAGYDNRMKYAASLAKGDYSGSVTGAGTEESGESSTSTTAQVDDNSLLGRLKKWFGIGQTSSSSESGSGESGAAVDATNPSGAPAANASQGSKLAGELGRYIKSKLNQGPDFQAVTEHPEHGGVRGGHARNSYHYSGRAIDIGAWGHEQPKILKVISQFNAEKGVKPVELLHAKNEPSGHGDHVHVAYNGGGLIGSGKSFSGAFGGGPIQKVTTNTGSDITTAGADTQKTVVPSGSFVLTKKTTHALEKMKSAFGGGHLKSSSKMINAAAGGGLMNVALQPGESVVSPDTVASTPGGAATFAKLNETHDPNATNKPRSLKAQGGGQIGEGEEITNAVNVLDKDIREGLPNLLKSSNKGMLPNFVGGNFDIKSNFIDTNLLKSTKELKKAPDIDSNCTCVPIEDVLSKIKPLTPPSPPNNNLNNSSKVITLPPVTKDSTSKSNTTATNGSQIPQFSAVSPSSLELRRHLLNQYEIVK